MNLVTFINGSKRMPPSTLRVIVGAVALQLSRDIAPVHGLVPGLELLGPKVAAKGDSTMKIVDHPTVPGAAGFHDEDPSTGRKRGFVFTNPTLDNGGTLVNGPNSVSVTVSHEMVEIVGDAPCNRWSDGPAAKDGTPTDYAYELADPVEGDSYDINGVAVSNFVYPAWFDLSAPKGSKFDFLGKLKAPFSMTLSGYMITRAEGGKEGQVFARTTDGKLVRGQHIGNGVHVHFGPKFPEWKKPAIIMKTMLRRAQPQPRKETPKRIKRTAKRSSAKKK